MAGPDSPPVVPARCGRIRSTSMAMPKVVLMSVSAVAPASRQAAAIMTMSVTSGLSLASSGMPSGSCSRTRAMTVPEACGSMAKTSPRRCTFGQEMLTSTPTTASNAGLACRRLATSANSSVDPPAMDTSARAPTDCSQGRSWLAKASMPGPCRPIELSMPDGVSAILGVGRPARGSAMTDLVTKAPRREMSKNRCSSWPLAAQPDAVMTGLGSRTSPRATDRSAITARPTARPRRRRLAPARSPQRTRPTGPGRRGTPGPRGTSGPCGSARRHRPRA